MHCILLFALQPLFSAAFSIPSFFPSKTDYSTVYHHSAGILGILHRQGLGSAKFFMRLNGGSPQMSSAGSSVGLLQGSRVLITGGGRGIGRAIALICAEEGADVAIVSRTIHEVRAVAEEIRQRFGTRALPLCADVTDEVQVAGAVSEAVSCFGGIDVLVNNAGAGCDKLPGHQQSADAFRRLLDINVVSALIVSSQVLNKCMLSQKAGSIINVSSRAGKVIAH